MARSKTFTPIHPLAMARALEEINARCGAVIMAAHTARDLADRPDMSAVQLRVLIDQFCKTVDDLQAALWTGEEG